MRGQPLIILGTVLLAKLKFPVEGKSELFGFRIVYLVGCQWLPFTVPVSGPKIRFPRSMGNVVSPCFLLTIYLVNNNE